MLQIKKHPIIFFLILTLISSIPSVIGLIHSGFPLTDDGNWMMIRFSAFYEALKAGQFPVRFLMRLNNGYGYPVSDFLYPLFMYLAVPLKILGFSFVDSIKSILVLSLIFSSVFSFAWLKKLFDNISSLVGSVFYTYFPYHLYDVYKRGSVGEVLSITILPFILWQIERKSLFFASVGISFLILAHNTLAVLFLILIIFYAGLEIFISKDKRKDIIFYLLILLIGFGLSAFFWIPAILDLKYTIFSLVKISEFENYFSDLNLIGIASLMVIISIFVLLISKKLQIRKHRLTLIMLIVGLVSIFLSASPSLFIWNLLPVSFIQFPFRFLSLTIISVSFLAAVLVSLLSQKVKIVGAVILIFVVIIFSTSFLIVKNYQNYPDTFYSTNQDTTTVKNEYMPKWVKVIPVKMYNSKVEVINGNEKPEILTKNANKTLFNVTLDKPRSILVNTAYFPGWMAYVNGKSTNIEYASNGFINLNLNKGKNNVNLEFGETNVRILSDIISLLSFILLISLTYFLRKKKI